MVYARKHSRKSILFFPPVPVLFGAVGLTWAGGRWSLIERRLVGQAIVASISCHFGLGGAFAVYIGFCSG